MTTVPKQKISAIAYLKSFGESIVDSYTGPRPPPVVFPPPSWEIDDETYGIGPSKRSKPITSPSPPPERSEVPTEPPISFARRIGALIDSLPSLPSAVAASLAPSRTDQPPSIEDEGKQGSPVPPEMDKNLIQMLSSEEIMNGQPANVASSDSNEKNTPHHSIWNILASLKSNTGWKDSEGSINPPPSAVEEAPGGFMMYAPLEPTNDSQLEFAESETLLEYVDDPMSASTSTTNPPEFEEVIGGSTSTSTSKSSSTRPIPTPTPKGREKHIWVPSTTQLSLLTTWWGYRLYLPPPVMAKLNGTSLKATARAAMLTTALKWLLAKIPLMMIPVQFRPAVKMLKTLSPVVGYVGVFIAWSWERVKSLDKGNGVVLTATWLLPVALIPMSWDAGDIYGPRLASEEERSAPSSDDNAAEGAKASKSSDDKGKQKQATKKSIFPW
ncbi:hypothetical protein BYT27DRAFT_7223798 [Phlegmacium glaucopus]|nr:hypothetical protein BYT27DRAFT_7223798 [Phlegmacium glaucopus]